MSTLLWLPLQQGSACSWDILGYNKRRGMANDYEGTRLKHENTYIMGNCSSCWPWRKVNPNWTDMDLEVVKRPRAVPSTAQYFSKTGKSVVEILKAAAPLVPVPLVTEVLDVVLTLIGICEQATALHGQIDDLKDQLCSLGVILVDAVEEDALPPATKTRVTKLRDNLYRIKSDLEEILNQGSAVLGFFADTNKGSVDDCVKRLNVALTEFHLSHALTTEQDLHRILQRSEDISSQLKQANRGIDEIGRDVKTLMKNQQLHSAPIFSSGMPVKLRHFRGRELLKTDLKNLLSSNEPVKPHIAILATGGMGKTTMAVEVMESDMVKRSYDNRFWVSCTGATSFALFLQVLAAGLWIKTDSGDLQTDIHSELTMSDAPRLIVLDNFETPWAANATDVERVLCSLASIRHVAIVITMRSNDPPSQNIDWHVKELKPLDLEASRQIYIDISPSAKGHEALDELLATLGHMPYAITLVATLGRKSGSQPDALLKLWKDGGTGILGNEGINRSISLSVDSKFMQSHPEGLSLLKTLSMLPAGATRDHIDWWAERLGFKIPLAISTLTETALISRLDGPSDSPKYFVYPVVQSYMAHSGLISAQDRFDLQEAAFKFILDHDPDPDDHTFKDDLKALASEGINLQGVLTFAAQQRMENHSQSDDFLDKKLLDALLTFSHYQLWSKPTLNVATLAVDVARCLDSKQHLASGLFCLGQIRTQLADFDGAIVALKEARELFTSLSNPLCSVQAAYLLIKAYRCSYNISSANALEKELRAYSDALNANDDRALRALIQAAIATNLICKGCPDEALACLSDALKDFEQAGQSFEKGVCLANMSHCYGDLGRYPESTEAAQLAAREFENLNHDAARNPIRQLECCLLLELKDYDQALQVAEVFLQESRRLGDILNTARALEYIAQIFEQKGDVAAVRLGYQSALEQYQIIGSGTLAGSDGTWRCTYNLKILGQAKRNDEDGEDCVTLDGPDGRRFRPRMWHLLLFG